MCHAERVIVSMSYQKVHDVWYAKMDMMMHYVMFKDSLCVAHTIVILYGRLQQYRMHYPQKGNLYVSLYWTLCVCMCVCVCVCVCACVCVWCSGVIIARSSL